MDTQPAQPKLVPLLVTRGAARAVDFYVQVMGAREVARYVHPSRGTLSHADLDLGGAVFSVSEEARGWNNDAPESLGGSPVVLQLRTDDVDGLLARACAGGAAVVFPLQDFCGERMARIRDPFGHLWILTQRVEALSTEEIQRRRDAFAASLG